MPKAAHRREVWGHMLLQKFLNLKPRKCHFQRFLQDIFSRFILRKSNYLCIFPNSSVVGKVQCLREKKASDVIRIMEK